MELTRTNKGVTAWPRTIPTGLDRLSMVVANIRLCQGDTTFFSSSLPAGLNKLECFILIRFFQTVLRWDC